MLFFNTAMITYFIEIYLNNDFAGPSKDNLFLSIGGGMIKNETWVFISNALLPPTIWFLDPWERLKTYRRNKELAKNKLSVLT
jgi:hypothetical protein